MRKIVFLLLLVTLGFSATLKQNEENLDMFSARANDPESAQCMDNWMDGVFGLRPHKVNFLMPLSYRFGNNMYRNYEDKTEYKHVETELQISLKLKVGSDLFGKNEKYYLAYTHTAFWQTYTDSSPFRETNYSPEGFVVFPVFDQYSVFHVRNLKFGIGHISNGQPGNPNPTLNHSRSLNFLYTEVTFQHQALVTKLKLWYRIPEFDNTDDNPDYIDYTGHSELNFNYFYHKHMITLTTKLNILTGNGSLASTYSYPLGDNTFAYVKFFHGYGESLIDYNNRVTKLSLGFSFSR